MYFIATKTTEPDLSGNRQPTLHGISPVQDRPEVSGFGPSVMAARGWNIVVFAVCERSRTAAGPRAQQGGIQS